MINLKKIILLTIIFLFSLNYTQASYKLETGSQNLVEQYDISTMNLDKEISRKEFVEILYEWFFDYKKDRGVVIDYSNYETLDNTKIFTDIDLETEFGKKLSYFAGLGAFSKREFFDPEGKVIQRDFFTIMKQLRIMFSLDNCKYHRICERESDEKTLFLKGTYLKYVSKIMDKSLRKYYSNAQSYIDAGYNSYLTPGYYFPLRGQTLNGCYAFSVRNILKYKNGIGVYIPKIEKEIGKKGADLWTYPMMSKFDEVVHIEKSMYYNIDTFIASLQAGEPVIISYMLDYYSYKDKKTKQVPHIVAAYSFDTKGVWVSETVVNKRKRIPWDKVFNNYGGVKLNRMFKIYYTPQKSWEEAAIIKENTYNYLLGEY